jgi:antitoxin component of RelBE/YafQ-DinJ toxin-antitoxin module
MQSAEADRAAAPGVGPVYDRTRYNDLMARAISVRLDDEALRALAQLQATGLTRSEAIRTALVRAASRLHDKRALAAEVAALEADDGDREEMLAIADLMESLRAPR